MHINVAMNIISMGVWISEVFEGFAWISEGLLY